MASSRPTDEDLDFMLSDKSLDFLYVNSFVIRYSAGDFSVGLMRTNKPFALLTMSATIAKALARQLTLAVESFEREADLTIPDFLEVREALDKANEDDSIIQEEDNGDNSSDS